MKRTFMMLIVLFAIYLGLQVLTKLFSDGHFYEYTLKSDDKSFIVKETFINNKKQSNYFFEISFDENIYYFQTYEDFSKADTIIKDIKYAEIAGYKCILPLFYGNKTSFDITCSSGNVLYNYSSIATRNRELDNWVNSLSEVYNVAKYKDDLTNTQTDKKTTIFPANVVKTHYITIENYRGVETINFANFKKIVDVPIFEKDQYSRLITGFSGKYYITADYTQKDIIATFIVVDTTKNEKISIKTNKEISFDSYIMGSVDDSFYLFDRKNNMQYQINIKTKKVIEVGNREVGVKVYYNGSWEWIPLSEINQDITFAQIFQKTAEFDRIDSVLGDDGYTYYYKKSSTGYDVFVSPTRAGDFKKYVFTIDNLDSIQYVGDYVYFKNEDTIYYYHESSGLRAIYQNPELKFNSNLKFGVYINN